MKPTEEQTHGSQWLAARTEAILGDRAGYGKTGQALLAARQVGAQRVAVLCPAVARLNWAREAVKWGLDLPIVRATSPEDHHKPGLPGPLLAIASYDGLVRSKKLRGAFNSQGWDVLVLDEGHKLKSAEANRTRAVYGSHIDGKRALSAKALHRWLLTASITPNGPGELWTHLHALWPQLIQDPYGNVMSYETFLEAFCVLSYGDYGVKVIGYRDREGLVNILKTIMLRRTEIAGLPELVLRDEPYPLEVEDSRLEELEAHEEFEELKAVLKSADARANDLEGIEDEFIHLATLRRLTGLLKAQPAVELTLSELGPTDKIVLFAMHREVLDQMENGFRMAGMQPAVVHGGVPDGRRNEEIDRFQNDPACRVFLGQIIACKEAITLHAANRVRLVEASWCPEDNAQAIARVHRRGQAEQVFADLLAIDGSIDALVQRVLLQKTRNVSALMNEDYHG